LLQILILRWLLPTGQLSYQGLTCTIILSYKIFPASINFKIKKSFIYSINFF